MMIDKKDNVKVNVLLSNIEESLCPYEELFSGKNIVYYEIIIKYSIQLFHYLIIYSIYLIWFYFMAYQFLWVI